MKCILFTVSWFTCLLLNAQNYQSGTRYFGANNYIEYNPGTLPIIISAPHGGRLMPNTIPNRTSTACNNDPNFTTAFDSNTQELTRLIELSLANLFGCKPHTIICLLDRDKLDCNRAAAEAACGNNIALQSWNDYHQFIYAAKQAVIAKYGRGIYIDIHGHGHSIQRNEIGYTLSATTLRLSDATLNTNSVVRNSSIRNLANNNLTNQTHAQLIRGANAFGTLLQSAGYASVPSQQDPWPNIDEDYFEGGYNTNRWSSADSGTIDGFQIETNYTGIRDSYSNMRKFADSIAVVIKKYIEQHAILPANFETCTPTENFTPLSNQPFRNNSLLVGRYQTGITNQKITLLEIDALAENQINPIQTIECPSDASNEAIILTNLATEGQLTLSPNQSFVTFAGYQLPANTSTSVFDHTTSRIIGIIDGKASYKGYTLPNSSDNKGTTDPFNTSNIRSAITTDGNKFYVSGGVSTSGALGGVWFYNKLIPTEANQIFNISNTRYVNIHQNKLFALHQANNSDTCQLIQLGNQLPTHPITNNDTIKLFQPNNNSVIGMQFSPDGIYCYIVANASSNVNGHVQKWKFINNKWSFMYNIIGQDGTAPRGFTANFSSNIATLYIVYATNVVKVIDTILSSVKPTNSQIIYSENTANTNLRGICFAPTNPLSLAFNFKRFVANKNKESIELLFECMNTDKIDYYIIERSDDGIHFTSLDKLFNQNTLNTYTDKKPLNGYNYYRVIAISKTSEKKYSETILLQFVSKESKEYTILQNSSLLKIVFKQPFTGWITFIDISGKTLFNTYTHQQLQFETNKDSNFKNKILIIKRYNNQSTIDIKKVYIY